MALWTNDQYKAQSFDQLCKSYLGSGWQGVDQYVNLLAAPLAKALATSNISGFADGTNLVLQNLDTIMTSVLFLEEQLVKQRWMEKVPSINPIYQFNVRDTYGVSRGAMAFAEGSIGPVGNAAWTRNTTPVTFWGVQRGTTVIANLAGALGGMFDNPIQEEEYDGTLQLLGNVERGLVWSDSSITDSSGNTVFFDGVVKQLLAQTAAAGSIFPSNVIDMHGKPVTFDVVSKIAALAAKQFVTTTRDMAGFWTPDTMQTFQLMKTEAERRALGVGAASDGGYTAGTPIKYYDTPIGRMPFIQDVMLDPFESGKTPLTTADSGAPSTPASVSASAASPTGAQVSNWLASDAATVYYSVSAFNAGGESLPIITGGYATPVGTAVSAGQVVTLTIPNVTGAYGYRIYRGTQSTGSDAAYIGQTAHTGGTDATFVDENIIMPGTDVGLVLNRNVVNMVIAQMSPMLKLPLAVQNTTIPFGLLYLFTLAIKAPTRQFMVINISQNGYTL